MNKVMLSGRLVKDAELKYTPGKGTAVAQVTIAVENYNSSTKEKGADFINLVVWGKQAEHLVTYSGKGKRIEIVGSIRNRSYDAKDGTKRYITEVNVRELELIDWINSGETTGNNDVFGEETPVDYGDMPF